MLQQYRIFRCSSTRGSINFYRLSVPFRAHCSFFSQWQHFSVHREQIEMYYLLSRLRFAHPKPLTLNLIAYMPVRHGTGFSSQHLRHWIQCVIIYLVSDYPQCCSGMFAVNLYLKIVIVMSPTCIPKYEWCMWSCIEQEAHATQLCGVTFQNSLNTTAPKRLQREVSSKILEWKNEDTRI